MRNKFVKILKLVFLIVILVLTAWIVFVFSKNFLISDPSVKAGLIGFMTIVIGGLFTHSQTMKREINARHFQSKKDGYIHIIEIIVLLMMKEAFGKKPNEDQLMKKMIEFKKNLIIWGSRDVIKAWEEYEIDSQNSKDTTASILMLDSVLKEIRKDLGHSDHNMKAGSLVSVFLDTDGKRDILRK